MNLSYSCFYVLRYPFHYWDVTNNATSFWSHNITSKQNASFTVEYSLTLLQLYISLLTLSVMLRTTQNTTVVHQQTGGNRSSSCFMWMTSFFMPLCWGKLWRRTMDIYSRIKMHLIRSLHPKSSVSWLYLLWDHGGRGLLSVSSIKTFCMEPAKWWMMKKMGSLQQMVRDHEEGGVEVFLSMASRVLYYHFWHF